MSLAACDGALRQAAHLRGHHRKAAAGFAGARGFHRGVERQQVGLARDLVDHADDVGDLARGILDLGHRLDRLGDHLAAAIGDLAGGAGGRVGLLGVLGVLLHGRGNLFHRGRGLFQAGGLLLGALRQIGRAGRDFRRGVGHLARRLLDLANGRADPFRRLVGVVLQDGKVSLILGGNALGHVALGERIEHLDEIVERLGRCCRTAN